MPSYHYSLSASMNHDQWVEGKSQSLFHYDKIYWSNPLTTQRGEGGAVLWIHPYKLRLQTNNKIKPVLWVSNCWNCVLISRRSALRVNMRVAATLLCYIKGIKQQPIGFLYGLRAFEVYFHRLKTLFDCNLLPRRIIMHYLRGSDTAGSPRGIVPTWQKQNPPQNNYVSMFCHVSFFIT